MVEEFLNSSRKGLLTTKLKFVTLAGFRALNEWFIFRQDQVGCDVPSAIGDNQVNVASFKPCSREPFIRVSV